MDYEAVIGLEIHFQLKTKTKLFCGCEVSHSAVPNTKVCPVCLGLPGALPALNREAIKMGIKIGLALNGDIHKKSRFYRKNYFYPDLPKGYQITQFTESLITGGYVRIQTEKEERKIGIERMNIEEEAASSIHTKTGEVLLDYNRSGIALLEVTTLPDLRSSKEAKLFLEKLRQIVGYTGASGCDMEKGEMRVDSNISIRKKGDKSLGVKVELKNLNSIRAVEHGLTHEFKRQVGIVKNGGTIVQETRLWDEFKGETRSMRTKEEAFDYRFFPEPDLVVLSITEEEIEEIKKELPKLPDERIMRYTRELGVEGKLANLLVRDINMANFFEEFVSAGGDPAKGASWIVNELAGIISSYELDFEHAGILPSQFKRLLDLNVKGVLTRNQAKDIIKRYLTEGADFETLIKEYSRTETINLDDIIKQVILENEELVEKFRQGKVGVLGALIGAVMKKTKGKANPKLAKERFLNRLEGNNG